MVQSASISIDAIFCEMPDEAAAKLIADARAGDLILVKGSRGVRTEKVVERVREAFGAVRGA